MFRLIEVTLSSQINPLPFHLHIWPTRLCMDELENCSNRYYHLEEISLDEIDLGKDCELIPVAHYTKVMEKFLEEKRFLFEKFLLGKCYSNKFTKIFSISSESDSCKQIIFL